VTGPPGTWVRCVSPPVPDDLKALSKLEAKKHCKGEKKVKARKVGVWLSRWLMSQHFFFVLRCINWIGKWRTREGVFAGRLVREIRDR